MPSKAKTRGLLFAKGGLLLGLPNAGSLLARAGAFLLALFTSGPGVLRALFAEILTWVRLGSDLGSCGGFAVTDRDLAGRFSAAVNRGFVSASGSTSASSGRGGSPKEERSFIFATCCSNSGIGGRSPLKRSSR